MMQSVYLMSIEGVNISELLGGRDCPARSTCIVDEPSAVPKDYDLVRTSELFGFNVEDLPCLVALQLS